VGKSQEDLWNMTTYISLYEDTLEAFVGTMVQIVDKKLSPWDTKRKIHLPGPGYGIASLLVYTLLDDIETSLNIGGRAEYNAGDSALNYFNKVYGEYITLADCETMAEGFPELKKSKVMLFDNLLIEMEKLAKFFCVKVFLLCYHCLSPSVCVVWNPGRPGI